MRSPVCSTRVALRASSTVASAQPRAPTAPCDTAISTSLNESRDAVGMGRDLGCDLGLGQPHRHIGKTQRLLPSALRKSDIRADRWRKRLS
jgi:hypothetical protein